MRVSGESTYHFGRLLLIHPPGEKVDYLRKGLFSDVTDQNKVHAWGLYDVEELTDSEFGTWFTGVLVKYKHEHRQEIVRAEEHRLQTARIPGPVVRKSRFVLLLSDGLIAYQLGGGDIEAVAFRRHFCSILEEANERMFFSAEVAPIREEGSVGEALTRLTTVRRIDISLHPSNPSSRDVWQRTDERMRNGKVGRFEQSFIAGDEGGLQPDDGMLADIAMAEDGYGTAEVAGVQDGKETTVRSDENPVNAKAPNADAPATSVLERLRGRIKWIRERLAK